MTRKQLGALLKRLAEINVPVADVGSDSVTIQGEDYHRALVLAKVGRYQAQPVGTNMLRLV